MVADRDIKTNELWATYRRNHSLKVRNCLVMAYYGYVISVAGRMLGKLPRHIGIDDLIAYGSVGLIQAVEGYDYRPDAKFFAYAGPKIRGAIIDGIREMGNGKRIIIEGKSAYRELPFVSTGMAVPGKSGGLTIEGGVEDKKAVGPQRTMERLDFWRIVMKGLSIRKQHVVFMYLVEGKNQEAIAREIGLTPSRASQLYREAIGTIKSRQSLQEYCGDGLGPRCG